MAVQVGGVFVGLSLSAQGFHTQIDLANRKISQFGVGTNATLAKVGTQAGLTAAQVSKLNTVNLSRASSSIAGLAGGLKGLAAVAGIGLSISSLQQFSDAAIRISNALKIAGLSGEELTRVYGSLYQSAQKNAAPLEALVQLYGRASLVQKELGVSTQELLKFTDNIALALRVGGKSAQESSGALLQLSQALGSGTIRAEEFNSMLEGALPIVQAAAAGITEAGGSVAKLRQLVVDGKVSSTAFFRGFEAGAVILESKVATATLTTAQALTKLRNSLEDAAGKFDSVFGITAQTAAAVQSLASGIELAASKAGLAKDPFDEFSRALRGTKTEAEGLYGWLEYISKFNVPANLGRYVAGKIISVDRTSPALPQSGVGEWAGAPDAPVTANVPLPRSRPQQTAKVNPISLKDFAVTAKETKEAADKAAESYERITTTAQARIAMLQIEMRTMGLSTEAAEKMRFEQELLNQASRRGIEISAEERAELSALAEKYAALASSIESARERREYFNSVANAGTDAVRGFASDLRSGVSASEAFGNALTRLSDRLLDLTLDFALSPIAKYLGGGINSVFSGAGGMSAGTIGGTGGGLGGLYAKGGVFNHGMPLTAFAKGGVVSGPTLFPFAKGAGLMGEAGPEAIMPLTRGPGGKLGVQAVGAGGGGGGTVVNIINNSSAKLTEQRSQRPDGGIDIKVMIDDAVAGLISSGESNAGRAMERRYGLNGARGMG